MRAEATGGMGTARDHPLPSLPVSPATDVGKRHDVVGIGNAIVDVIAHASEDFLDEHGLIKGAMTLIDGDRAIALYEAMGAGRESSGGSAANTVAGVASFGGRAAFIGKVGFFMVLFVWVRWTLPRFRYDQLMSLGWKRLFPLALANLMLAAVLVAFGIAG